MELLTVLSRDTLKAQRMSMADRRNIDLQNDGMGNIEAQC